MQHTINFANQDLRGRSFRGANISGANFSYCDIRGADFSDTTLVGANFTHAKAGLRYYQNLLLIGVALILSGICGFAAAFSGVIATDFIFFAVQRGLEFTFVAAGIALMTLTVFCVLINYQALEIALGASAMVGATAIAASAVTAIDGVIAGSVAGVLVAVNIAVALVMAVSFTMTIILTRAVGVILAVFAVIVGGIVGVSLGALVTNNHNAFVSAISVGVCTALVGTLLGSYLARQVVKNEVKFLFLRSIAVNLASIRGTSFTNANLTDTNFQQSVLKHCDFRNATLRHTNFHLAQKLDCARVGNTILANPKVRDLLVNKRGVNKLYINCNLKGANLAGADLSEANFTEADLSEATFVNAILERANFTKAQAINTNFRHARLTAACLEAWNIDSTTQLDEVICDYVYLLNNTSERRPSSGVFAPGEFTKLFEVFINTVDLIFQNGLDLQALYNAIVDVKAANQDTQLAVRSIENKGDGVVVVKVEVTEEANKTKIHADFTQSYQVALQAIEAKYQAQLESKDEQIALYRQHQADLKNLMQMFVVPAAKAELQGKLVVIKIGDGDLLTTGYPVTLQIATEGAAPFIECTAKLAAAPELHILYSQWQSAYYRTLQTSARLEIPDTQITNISRYNLLEECDEAAERFKQYLNYWLNSSESFRPIKEKLLEQLSPRETIRVIIQTEDRTLLKLPFQLWNFFDTYRYAESALFTATYNRIEAPQIINNRVKILAILGDSTGIDVSKDQKILEQLPNSEVTYLVEPQRKQINDELWQQPWDILFFAGHSYTKQEIGQININRNETLSINQLKNALQKAIQEGLKLAIFNSCDGLGLALNLAELNTPQMIVMREPVPDKVAQEFLKNFLTAFASGKTLYLSVREAREKLQGLENEFPSSAWLPVIFQNPAQIPPLWDDINT
jgi:uncharacterized protein YjbI with pentapeptide repeats